MGTNTALIYRTFKEEDYEIEIEYEFSFDPGYPPPTVQNHDHPGFSDPGDPGHFEVLEAEVTRCSIIGNPTNPLWQPYMPGQKFPVKTLSAEELDEMAQDVRDTATED